MIAIGLLFIRMLCDCFKLRQQPQAEILVLRHQLNVLRQLAPRRPLLRWADRALFIWLYRRCPRILNAITIVRPETVLRWHRMGFAAYWRWKSRSPGGRPRIAQEVRELIRRMSLENPLWGATKIHGELLKLGIEVAQSTVSIYMVPRRDRPLQTSKTFLRNHMDGTDDCLSTALRISCSWPSTAAAAVGCGDPKPDGRLAGAPKLPKRSRGTAHRNISSATTTEHSGSRSRLASWRWAFGTGPRHTARPGRMATLNA